ncbi:MAG TPA: FAD-dependent oxidoreductase [Planctomycetota bacterium]|nr:FAD-dependent oxidoreductase [Planctomycetota bacterium]
MKTAILGAGVSGLALGRMLIEGGLPRGDVHLFEAAPVAGGLCRSRTVEGFTYDVAGGHILYSKDADALGWMKACAGGDSAFVRRERNTKIRFGERWVHYPFENGLGDLPPEVNFDCLKGYIEAWHRRSLDGSSAPQDFASWVRWRFGEGIARHFMDPYNDKVWKRDLRSLSSDWVAGRVPDAPIEDVLRSAVGIRTEGYTHQSTFYYPERGGFQAITDGIGAAIADRVRLSTPVGDVTRHGEAWRVDGEDFDCVVSTLPLTDLPDIVRGMPTAVAEAMRALEFNSITCILVALDRPEPGELSWIYLPHGEQGPANRVTYMSGYSPGNAPEGRSSLLCEVTHPGGAPQPGPELEREVVAGLAHAGLLRPEQVLFTDRAGARHAYVVFDHGYRGRREAALGWLEGQGLFALGRFGRFDYDNSDQCVVKARGLAERLLERAKRG